MDVWDLCYEQVLDDLVAFGRFMVRRSPEARCGRWLTRLAYPAIAAAILGAWAALAPVDWFLMGTFGATVPVYTFLLWNRYDQMAEEQARRVYGAGRNAVLLGPVRLTISAAGLRRVTRHSDSLVGWPAVERVETDGAHVFLFIGAATAHIVPRSAFVDDAAFQAFLLDVRRFLASATQ